MNKMREIGEMKKTKARNVQCICIKGGRKNRKKFILREINFTSVLHIYISTTEM